MTLIDWLSTPGGVDFVHAIVLLVVAIAGYLNWLTKRQLAENRDLLDKHIDAHALDVAARSDENAQGVVDQTQTHHNI